MRCHSAVLWVGVVILLRALLAAIPAPALEAVFSAFALIELGRR
jgi:hypothetical protein